MTDSNYEWQGQNIKSWTKGVQFEDEAKQQVRLCAAMPFVEGVAVMPDVHAGIGATVGSVIATKGALMPAAVGVDIGCGMVAMRTTLTANDLPDSLGHIRAEIERAVPHGRTSNGGSGDRGAWANPPASVTTKWKALDVRFQAILAKHPKIGGHNAYHHLGTMGGGNHFVEVCLDEEDRVWVMLHSGSRGVGNRIGTYFINKAKEEMQRYHIGLADKDLSYLVEDTVIFDDYIEAMTWAQDFAAASREIMLERTVAALRKHLPPFATDKVAINCHHNYTTREQHRGKSMWITRKGAVQAREGTLGIIPGSMGTGSFIVEGLGNDDSFHSCSHGAGRVMSRTKAKKLITLEDHIKATEGIECRKDVDVIDESPAAYKDVNAVMAAQSDLVKIKFHLRQIINVKG
jgi:tRNA-splicing ligase RtcB